MTIKIKVNGADHEVDVDEDLRKLPIDLAKLKT
jgi:hypothetical protein